MLKQSTNIVYYISAATGQNFADDMELSISGSDRYHYSLRKINSKIFCLGFSDMNLLLHEKFGGNIKNRALNGSFKE